MKRILLTQGRVALVDDADYDWLNQKRWYAHQSRHTFYATRHVRVAKNKKTSEQMHRLILGLQPSDNQECDHRDGNGLNNQRVNLRICSVSQNSQSSRKREGCTSKYKGVHWDRRDRKWISQTKMKEKRIRLGCFDSEVDAARAYDAAALKHYGEFAQTNEMLGLLR